MHKKIILGGLIVALFLVVPVFAVCDFCPAELPDGIEPYTDLIAGQTLDVGDIYVWEDEDCLFVWYEVTAEDWFLTETHLDVQCGWEDIPQTKKGNPIPGKFAYKESFEITDYQTTWCKAIEKPDCLDCGEEIAIAAHAVVAHVSDECMTFYSGVDQGITTGSLIGPPAVLAWEPYSNTDPSYWDSQLTHGFTSDADWIWETERVQSPVDGSVVDFYQTITVPGNAVEITSGEIYITCDNGYEIYVNDFTSYLLRRQLGSGWRSSDLTEPYVKTNGWQSVENIDISGSLQIGANDLWIATANEYMGPDDGQSPGTIDTNPAGLIYEGEICYKVVDQTETAMGDGTGFPGANWFMWFGYEGVCFADLELTKTITTDPPYAVGDDITWVVEVKNLGPDTAVDVVVKDYPPDSDLVSIKSVTPSEGTFDAGTGDWEVGDLPSGESETLTIVTTIDDRGAIINSAEVFESGSSDPDSTPGNYDPADHAGTDEDDSDVASIIFFPVAGNAYIGYEDRTGGDFDYNDFGMNMEVTEVYKNDCLASIDMEFTSVVKQAGDVHDIHIERVLDPATSYDYTVTRSVPAAGTETPAGAGSSSGDFNIIIFDSASFAAGKVVNVNIEITDGCEAFVIPLAPRCDLDPVFNFYDPWMNDKTAVAERHILDVQPATGELGSTGYDVPYILVVPSFNWPAPAEGNTINNAAEAESGTWYYPFFDECYSSNCVNHPGWYNEGVQKP